MFIRLLPLIAIAEFFVLGVVLRASDPVYSSWKHGHCRVSQFVVPA